MVVVIAVAVFARVVSMRSFFVRGSSSVVLVIGVRWLVETNGVLKGEVVVCGCVGWSESRKRKNGK